MSTITPLLDTLLHNVLGRRADLDRVASRQPDLPLGGVTYTPAVRHGTSDTPDETLQRHPQDGSGKTGASEKASARAAISEPRPLLDSRAAETTSRSSTTHFSAEARAISRILEKFPASAPVISTSTVMLPAGRAPEVAVLAATLAGQIRYSGLFYESHLRQWLVGQHDQQELMKEPQNRLIPSPAAGAQSPSGSGGQEFSMLATRERAAAHPGESTASQTQSGNAASMTSVQDDLQSILRHQLELMTHSLIRWEGFLTPQVPVHWEIERDPETAVNNDSEPSRIWRSRLKLALPELGLVDLEVSLQNRTISISGSVESPYLAWMTIQGRHLGERMADAGLQLSALHFSPQGRNERGEEIS